MATGTTYPSTLDSWSDKVAGDFLTVVDVNQRTSAIEQVEAKLGTTDALTVTNGSVSAPAYSFSAETTSGVYRKSANVLGISVAGAQVLEIDATGIRGVGAGFVHGAGLGVFGSIGQNSKNNAGTPNTQFDLYAHGVILQDVDNSTYVKWNPGTITNNISTAGPAANGRDQAGAFAANSWLHFYRVWNSTTLATLSSYNPPIGKTYIGGVLSGGEVTGPAALPTGYTHFEYAGAVYLDGASQLIKTRIMGDTAYYEAARNALTNGTQTGTEATVSLAALVPPNALATLARGYFDRAGAGAATASVRVVTGSDYFVLQTDATNTINAATMFEMPNVSQQFFYIVSIGSTIGLTVDICGYRLPNGGA